MIIDIHTHVGKSQHAVASVEQLKAEMRKNKVNFSACFVLGNNLKQDGLTLARECGKNIFPFFRFDPNNTTIEELEKYLPFFKGVKLHPRLENFDPLDERFATMFEIIKKHKIPILIHTRKENNDNSDPDRLLTLVEKYRGINFIFGHFANAVESVIGKAKDIPNLFLETSIVSSPKIIEMAVRKCGSEKILFGSDFPYSDQELELQKVLRSEIGSRDKDNILYKNALRLLGVDSFDK